MIAILVVAFSVWQMTQAGVVEAHNVSRRLILPHLLSDLMLTDSCGDNQDG